MEHHPHTFVKNPYFTGRQTVLERINTWLNQRSSNGTALVVTGCPGSGKSAILCQIVNQADTPLVAIHAANRSAEEFVEILGKAVGTNLQAGVPHQSAAAAIGAELRKSSRRTVIVVDALDEAEERDEIGEMLSSLTGIDCVWLLVGTRPDVPPDGPGKRVASLAPRTEEIDLDSAEYQATGAIEEYVRRRLLGSDDSVSETEFRIHPPGQHHCVGSCAASRGPFPVCAAAVRPIARGILGIRLGVISQVGIMAV